MKTFEDWFTETRDILILEGSGRMIFSKDEWIDSLKEAWKAGYKQCDSDSIDSLEEELQNFVRLQNKE